MLNSRTPLMAAPIAALLILLVAGVQAQGPSPSAGPSPSSSSSPGQSSSSPGPSPSSSSSPGQSSPSPGPSSSSSPGQSSPSPGPASSSVSTVCMNALLNLTDCLAYVEQGSNETKPDNGCCPAFSGLVDSSPQCLCQLVSSGEAYGIEIDKVKAFKLPTACHVVTPPVSMCSLFGIPVSSPMGPAPAPSPMSGAISPSSVGSIAGSSPSMSPGTNDGSSSFRVSKLLIGLSLVSISIAVF